MLPPDRRIEQNGMRATGDFAAPTMKHPSENQPQEVLAGLIERVTYHNAENGFCVLRAKARGHRDIVTVVGHAAIIAAGEWITATGEWVNDRTHGKQFKARFLRTSPPTSADKNREVPGPGMIRGIGPSNGIGPMRAAGIVAAFPATSKRLCLPAAARRVCAFAGG